MPEHMLCGLHAYAVYIGSTENTMIPQNTVIDWSRSFFDSQQRLSVSMLRLSDSALFAAKADVENEMMTGLYCGSWSG